MKRKLFFTALSLLLLTSFGNATSILGINKDESEKAVLTVTYQIANYPENGWIYGFVNGNYFASRETINSGDNVEFEVYPSWGYRVQDWVVNGNSLGIQQNSLTLQNVQEDLTVNVFLEEYNYPNIEPSTGLFALSNPQDVVFTVDYGSETGISAITTFDGETQSTDTLVLGVDYDLTSDELIIYASYLESLNPEMYDQFGFEVHFASGYTTWISILVVEYSVPTFKPNLLSYDLTNPGDLFAFIIYVTASEVTLYHNNVPLVEGVDYEIQGTFLFIKQGFISQHLQTVGQSISLVGVFDTEQEATLEITAVQTGITNATINPNTVLLNNAQMPEYIDVVITWNDASEVTGMIVRGATEFGVMEFPWYNYLVTNNGDGTANLRIFFDEDKIRQKTGSKEQTYYFGYEVSILFDQGSPASLFLTVFETLYQVNVTVVPESAGFIYGALEYAEGEDVDLYADPNWGYAFDRWEDAEGNVLGTDANLYFKMPSNDVNLTAYFVPGYFVYFWTDNNGFGEIKGFIGNEEIFSGNSHKVGKQIRFVAIPQPGYKVATWYYNWNNLNYEGLEYTIDSLSEDAYIFVVFEEIPVGYHMITYGVLGANGELAAEYNNNSILSGQIVPANATVTFTATPNPQYHVKEWVINGNVVSNHTDNVLVVDNISEAIHVTVEFELISSVTDNIALRTTIYPNPFQSVVNIDSSVELARISIVGIDGRILRVIENPGNQINLVELPSGVYLFNLETADGERVIQPIIKR